MITRIYDVDTPMGLEGFKGDVNSLARSMKYTTRSACWSTLVQAQRIKKPPQMKPGGPWDASRGKWKEAVHWQTRTPRQVNVLGMANFPDGPYHGTLILAVSNATWRPSFDSTVMFARGTPGCLAFVMLTDPALVTMGPVPEDVPDTLAEAIKRQLRRIPGLVEVYKSLRETFIESGDSSPQARYGCEEGCPG